MRCLFIGLFLFFAGSSFGQIQIDSMVVHNPDSDTIFLHGKFGSVLGKTFLDTSEMQVYTWTDTIIVSHLPPFFIGNKPSCGPVKVTVNSLESNQRILDMGWIEGDIYPPDDTLPQHGSPFDIYWRYDFHSFFLNRKDVKITIPVNTGKTAEFDFHNRKINFSQGYFIVSLDSNYYLPQDGYGYWYRPKTGEWYGYGLHTYCSAPLDARKTYESFMSVNPKKLTSISYINSASKELTVLNYPYNTILSCYDLLGRKHPLEFLGSDGSSSTYSLRSLSPGVYFVNDGRETVKFLITE